MIGISVMNWFFGAGIGLLLTLGCVLSSVMWWKDEKTLSNHIGRNSCADTVVRTLCQPYLLVLSALCLCGTHHHSDHDESSLYDGHAPLLIFGAVVANSWFRDRYKYQGLFGIVNAWYAGMVFLYATMTYGLWTAIVVHALYDIMISLFRFVVQRIK